ncbi:MAG: hypothetical protein IPI49_23750 [Myxococcales bacterium]|nr:hypothetical protein [Myxococcales bacterium]
MRPRPFRPFATRRRARRVKQLRGAGAALALGSGLAGVSSPVDGSHPRVLGSGDRAFVAIVDRVARAESSVEIRAFLWRDDEAGNLLAEAVVQAADRGAKVLIQKDRIAAVYEYTGGNKQSFFHKRVDPIRGLQAWLLGAVYRAPGSIRQRPNPLLERIIAHDNIRVEHTRASASTQQAVHHRRALPGAGLHGHRRQSSPRVDRRHGRGRRAATRGPPARPHGRRG